MRQQRLSGLADGIFAIVMTLLALELKVPELDKSASSLELIDKLMQLSPVFISFVLSFALLFTYWRAHHFLTSVYAKTLTVGLANYNALFFLFVTTIPFSAHLLGKYSDLPISIFIYGLNVILIGLTLLGMRMHIEKSKKIDTIPIALHEWRSGYIRIVAPVVFSVIGIFVGLISTKFALVIFVLTILFNLIPTSSNIIYFFLDIMFADKDEVVQSNYDPELETVIRKNYLDKKSRYQTKIEERMENDKTTNKEEGEDAF